MSAMPYGAATCIMEGCNFRGGSTCVNCGTRLRCPACGWFVREDGINGHLRTCKIADMKWPATPTNERIQPPALRNDAASVR